MDERPKDRWYYSVTIVVVAILCVGPLALPLLILSPKFTKAKKALISILVIAATVWLARASIQVTRDFMQRLDEVKEIYNIK